MNQEELDEILCLHKFWLKDKSKGKQAGLWHANLQKVDLHNTDLRNADLWDADLQNANLWDANLSGANLQYANLHSANLYKTDFWHANLRCVIINPDNPSVFYKSDKITILDTGLDCFYVFNNYFSTTIDTLKQLDFFKETISVLSLNLKE